jgi:hypothetical protein
MNAQTYQTRNRQRVEYKLAPIRNTFEAGPLNIMNDDLQRVSTGKDTNTPAFSANMHNSHGQNLLRQQLKAAQIEALNQSDTMARNSSAGGFNPLGGSYQQLPNGSRTLTDSNREQTQSMLERTLQMKQTDERLAKLEKMYQQLSQLERIASPAAK